MVKGREGKCVLLIFLRLVVAGSFQWRSACKTPQHWSRVWHQQLSLSAIAQTDDSVSFEALQSQMKFQNIPRGIQQKIQISLKESELDESLLFLARDFVDRPEVFSTILQNDFGFTPLVAHHTRALAMSMIKEQQSTAFPSVQKHSSPVAENLVSNESNAQKPLAEATASSQSPQTIQSTIDLSAYNSSATENSRWSAMKTVLVNEKASKRRATVEVFNYALPQNYEEIYTKLAEEMDDFMTFMTKPTTLSQEEPIREVTAKTYLKHSTLFLGWYTSERLPIQKNPTNASNLSLFEIIPNKEKESAHDIIDYIMWLRSRDTSVSYEANVLRGLIKLLKYRFAAESQTDSSYGGKTFDDVPVIKELRKLHRDANKRTKLAPRSSDEQKKWLSWPEFLHVLQSTKAATLEEIARFGSLAESDYTYRKGDKERLYSRQQAKVAEAYQCWLILAIFANVPDRQRTVRELEIGRTLIRDSSSSSWAIKHSPDDYKTGKSYGERPAMQLPPDLSLAIDNFIEDWRPSLYPNSDFLFVQGRTGNKMTADSVFQRVSRQCFIYTGKRTNPHLLRDMIVTHVRESDASEKELEALALFMGHSIETQRSSYDRRSLTSKIAPAVNLLSSVNKVM